MKGIIDALKALLVPLGYAVYYVDVPERPAYPYVLLWGSNGAPGEEPSIGCDDDLADILGVTIAAGLPDGVLTATSRVRPLLRSAHLVAGGLSVDLRPFDSQNVQVDRDVTIPDTNRHPAYGVDLYTLTATPA